MSTTQSTAARATATTDYEAALDDITERGIAAIRGVKTSAEETVAGMRETGREALDGARDVRDSLTEALLKSVRTRPYTTLALAGLIGFAYGALRRR